MCTRFYVYKYICQPREIKSTYSSCVSRICGFLDQNQTAPMLSSTSSCSFSGLLSSTNRLAARPPLASCTIVLPPPPSTTPLNIAPRPDFCDDPHQSTSFIAFTWDGTARYPSPHPPRLRRGLASASLGSTLFAPARHVAQPPATLRIRSTNAIF